MKKKKTRTPETDEYVKSRASLGYCVEGDSKDFMQHLERKNIALEEALANVLRFVPSASCHDFHHPKKDQHEIGEECPLVARFGEVIDQARSLLTDRGNSV